MHTWPVDPAISSQWTKFVQKKRANFTGPTEHSVLCSQHFENQCFDQHHESLLAFGYGKGRKLLPTAVPTIWKDSREDIPVKKPRKAALKREHYRVCIQCCFLHMYMR